MSSRVHVQSVRSARKAAAAAFVGTTIEWYDFFIYATAASIVFGKIFFPATNNPLIGVLAAIATYAVGFATRPIGGAVIGRFGDKYGRRPSLIFTIVLMGLSTFCIGLLPTYNQIGWWAPLFLVFLRLMQGFAVGGEWGGAASLTVEHAPSERVMFYSSFTQLGSPGGALLASGAFSVVSLRGEADLIAWGWRIPFLVAIILVGIGLFIRFRVDESPEYEKSISERNVEVTPFRNLWFMRKKALLVGIGLMSVATGGYYIIVTLLQTFAIDIANHSTFFILTTLSVAAAAEVVTLPVAGWAADKFGPKMIVNIGVIASIVLVAPVFYLLKSPYIGGIVLVMVLMRCVGQSGAYGPLAGVLASLFSVEERYSGTSIAYHVGGAIFGGFSPLVGAALLAAQGGNPIGLIVFFIFLCVITFVSMVLADRMGKGKTQTDNKSCNGAW